MEKVLLTVKEFSKYLGIGETKARELLSRKDTPYAISIDGKKYANKRKLDEWLDQKRK